MKKIWLLSLVALLVLGMSAIVAAQEQPVWEIKAGVITRTAMTDPSRNARVILLEAASGECNRHEWEVEFRTAVEMAQWLRWSVSGTEWNWYVRKPGDYFADCSEFIIASNGNVTISFDDFSELAYQTNSARGTTGVEGVVQPEGDFAHEMQVRYTFVQGTTVPDGSTKWYSPEELNDQSVSLVDNRTYPFDPTCTEPSLHEGAHFKLWNRITVVDCNSTGVYVGGGKATIAITNHMPWLDNEGKWGTDPLVPIGTNDAWGTYTPSIN